MDHGVKGYRKGLNFEQHKVQSLILEFTCMTRSTKMCGNRKCKKLSDVINHTSLK